ncbi:L-threonine dehydratase biosynthetic IlvA [Labrenzia sp. THAF191b]|uniref:threonine dehydratase n=1 Tax=unclassified Labrenzia TaxID=2648686 RepID=UPI00126882E9|nr:MULTISPECIES: threonine dehydratase [unclassified Labrenzia]QFS96009.1 L-threonine dehydratase biosynthetic IlvA [Labrenzia sp. THAF191b]QFT02324.1 L-threonine dehydratase biosynthetic IlvA [Labrenzia sp. THAF191a]QFT13865.1 L-threonine dehydratase biosynthetic IlvA [Labrenzia sp. THAF187b]
MTALFTLDDLEAAFPIVRQLVPETPSYAWPLLKERFGLEIAVKHENHTPIGAFKARSSIVYIQKHIEEHGRPCGVVTATRGNHGQSMALAARTLGLPATIVVPEGNAEGKNRAMKAFGADLVIDGRDFDISRRTAERLASESGFLMVPSFHRNIVLGVATYALEFFRAHDDLDVVYVPVGMGSGACGLITVRDLLGLKTEIVPVVTENAPAYRLSVEAGKIVTTETAATFADGMACREPVQAALDILQNGSNRIATVTDDEISAAIRVLFADTHNLAEGAGAAALAALMQDAPKLQGRKAGIILSGGNLDETAMQTVLSGGTPVV